MKCKRCNRRLKNKDSINLGYGQYCYEKIFGKQIKVRIKKEKEINDNQTKLYEFIEPKSI